VRHDASRHLSPRSFAPRRTLLCAALTAATLLAGAVLGAVPARAINPSASFTFSPAAPATGEPVRFDASATTEAPPLGPNARRYDWEFDGDNDFNDAEGVVVTRTFAAGSHTARLRVTGSDGITTSTVSRTVNVAANRRPVAAFIAVPRRPAVNEVVQFTSVSSDPDGSLRSQTWDLDGDGAFDDSSGQIAFTLFHSPGTRLVRLRVVDSAGAVAIGNLILVVGDPNVTPFPLISPFPVVRLAGHLTSRGVRVRVLSVTAPAESRVVVRCRGRLCPARRAVTRTRRTGRPVRIRKFQRKLQAGVVLEVLVSRPGMIGKHTRFLIRKGRAPRRRDRCLLPGTTAGSSCPGR
jgi:PKD domain